MLFDVILEIKIHVLGGMLVLLFSSNVINILQRHGISPVCLHHAQTPKHKERHTLWTQLKYEGASDWELELRATDITTYHQCGARELQWRKYEVTMTCCAVHFSFNESWKEFYDLNMILSILTLSWFQWLKRFLIVHPCYIWTRCHKGYHLRWSDRTETRMVR